MNKINNIISNSVKQTLLESSDNVLAQNGSVRIVVSKGTDKVTKKPTRHIDMMGAGKKTRLITSVDPKWNESDIKNHLQDVHKDKLVGFKWNITEASSDVYSDMAKAGFDRLMAGAATVGAYKGNVRVYYRHTGGSLSRTFVGDHGHKSYAHPSNVSGSGHYFASHYSARPGHNVYVHVKLPLNADLSDQEALAAEIHKQNPHTEGTGHAHALARDIVEYHG